MQVEQKTEKGTLRFELLPNEAKFIGKNIEGNSFCYSLNGIPSFIDAKDGETLIGLTSEVTEEQAKMMLTAYDTFFGKAYKCKCEYGKLYTKALDSFKSLMQHLQVYEVNPLAPPAYPKAASCENDYVDARYEQYQYDKAQENVGKWVVLFKSK